MNTRVATMNPASYGMLAFGLLLAFYFATLTLLSGWSRDAAPAHRRNPGIRSEAEHAFDRADGRFGEIGVAGCRWRQGLFPARVAGRCARRPPPLWRASVQADYAAAKVD